MFATLVVLLFTGLPVGFVLGGTALGFAGLAIALDEMRLAQIGLLSNRIFGGVVENPVLVAVPMFILMGTFLERSGMAEDLLESLSTAMRRVPAGLGLAVMLIGILLAASTGIIGASVVMLTLLALPTMLRQGYDPAFSSGIVAAAGTLGILIPPSIMLVVMGDLLSISVGRLFVAALLPGMMLSAIYLTYIVLRGALQPRLAALPGGRALGADVPRATKPGPAAASSAPQHGLLRSLLAPLFLMVLVLGSILAGWATPTEASGVGAAGAMLLVAARRRLTLRLADSVTRSSIATTGMIFFIFVGATAFSYVFRLLGGDQVVSDLVGGREAGAWVVLLSILLLVFVLGFFFDWIEITLIVLPIFAPLVATLDFGDHVQGADRIYWFATLVAINLQTSFLTPPFGFALFYMKGAAPPDLRMIDVYRGIIPFVLMQVAALCAILAIPEIALWLPDALMN
ncbi:TRAP transporter large permease subunit [Aquibium sp. A9E412]|uniref:TRAP transporter large permease n=1 Tax=Aquibium sp. A9E412 TaxID=2976767 RepID=UPI0025B1C0DD|nr:TRAP transporter large permease subunit [Aquibium sp. A9E412]MDN2567921.1 TRAP transporter large permease subunit [Aquibium sp. A9E412]